jgi:hypothetical protein
MTPEDLEQLNEDWPRMRQEISDLKAQNKLLEECLRDSVILSRTLYAYLGTDRMSNAAENVRREIKKLLDGLHKRLEIGLP